jgi:hypothetical protein
MILCDKFIPIEGITSLWVALIIDLLCQSVQMADNSLYFVQRSQFLLCLGLISSATDMSVFFYVSLH